MRKLKGRRPSAALIVAMVALVAALAGTAVAGGGFVTTTKFKKYKQNNNTSVSAKLGGPINYASVTVNVPQSGTSGQDVSSPCPAGTQPIGGGIKVSNDADEFVNDSHPTSTGWAGTVFNNAATPHQAIVTAICATGATTGSRPAS
jgi:hypothetical protein